MRRAHSSVPQRLRDHAPPASGRAGDATALPRPLPGELARHRLLDALARRFDVEVTVVAAGAGFGKTTLLAQAVRSNEVEPRGIDVWFDHDRGARDAGAVAQRVAAALGRAPVRQTEPIATVLDAIRSWSPLEVCVIVDDVHELVPGSTVLDLMVEVLRRVPANGHVLLSGRRIAPELPLERFRAADQLAELGEHDLAFTPAEVAAVAAGAGRTARDVADLGGWPALVRLGLAAPAGSPERYVWEEVLADLPAGDRQVLAALSALGSASPAVLAEITDVSVDPAAFAGRIPLVTEDGNGRLTAHDLWRDVMARRLDPSEQALYRKAGAALVRAGDVTAAGWLAIRHGDGAGLRVAARELVRATLSALPVETAAAWTAAAAAWGPDVAGSDELRMLDAALRHARDATDPTVEAEVRSLWQAMQERGDIAGESAALALLVIVAHANADLATLLEVAARASALDAGDGLPVLRLARPVLAAAVAEMEGRPDAALDALGALAVPDWYASALPAEREIVGRLAVNLLVLAGRADEAVPVADAALRSSASAHVRRIPLLARWHAGDPTGFDGGIAPPASDPSTNAKDRFRHAAFSAVILASYGGADAATRAVEDAEHELTAEPEARDSALVAMARAAAAVARHDDAKARSALEAHLARHPVDDAASAMHLRRFLPLTYVLVPSVRARWKTAALGPSQARARDVADCLLAARRGALARDAPLPSAAEVLTALPLPWSVELATRAATAGHPAAGALLRGLTTHAGPAVERELARLAPRRTDRTVREVILGLTHDVRIEAVGPLRVVVDGVPLERAELRRARVRELLGFLVVEPTLRRERALELLWGDLDLEAAAANLRVTLAHLRKVVGAGVRADRTTIELAPGVEVDLWEIERDLAAAARARTDGDDAAVVAHLEAAVRRWRGEPLTDLARFPEVVGRLEGLRAALADAALTLGERGLTEGRATAAIDHAERVLRADPYRERAYRLLIAAHVQRRDRRSASGAAKRLQQALDDLGVGPDRATEMLLRRNALV